MGSFTAREATKFFRSYELKCDEELVQQWLNHTNINQNNASVTEDHVWAFSYWWGRKGTAYEEGIDNKTKIERLLTEIQSLKEENETLWKEKRRLELDLGILPF